MPTLADGLTAMRTVIANQVKAAPGITALLDVSDFYLFDQLMDARPGNPEDESNFDKRIWLTYGNNQYDFDYSNAEIMVVRRYELGIGSGSMKLADSEVLEGIVVTALTRLAENQDNDGAAIDMDQFAPLRVETLCSAGDATSDREPVLDPEEFQMVLNLTQVAYVSRSDLLAA